MLSQIIGFQVDPGSRSQEKRFYNREQNSVAFCVIQQMSFNPPSFDRAERNDLKSRLWLFFPPFLVPPKNRGKKKRRMNSKNRDFKSCLSARSLPFHATQIINTFLIQSSQPIMKRSRNLSQW